MGRIKTKLVKRVAISLVEKIPDSFTKTFHENSRALGSTMPSKRIRNMIAGYITRIKKNTKKIIED